MQKTMVVMLLLMLMLLWSNTHAARTSESSGQQIIRFFTDEYTDGGFGYAFGGRSALEKKSDPGRRYGNVLEVKLDDRVFAGTALHIPDHKPVSIASKKSAIALRMRIMGRRGGERLLIGIIDQGDNGKNRTTVKCRSNEWCTITTSWQTVTIPLSGFSNLGEQYYEALNAISLSDINWDAVSGVSFSSEKEMNLGASDTGRIATVFIDDIELVTITGDTPEPVIMPWRLRNEEVKALEGGASNSQKTLFSWCDTAMAPFISAYTYGEPTSFRVIKRQEPGNAAVLAAYFNDNEWSGVTLYSQHKPVADLLPYREKGCLEFMVKGEVGGEQFAIGLIDDESDGTDKKVQVKVMNGAYGTVSREWQLFTIPLADFSNYGKWWHSDAHYEINDVIDWKKISALRFSTSQYANKKQTDGGKKPAVLYFANIRLVRECDAFSNTLYWKTFSSNAADLLIDNFERQAADSGWKPDTDPKSHMILGTGKNELDGSTSLSIGYTLADWGAAGYDFTDTTSLRSNWSHHSGLQCAVYSSEAGQTCVMMVIDSGNEAWTTHFPVQTGWQTICIPFEQFRPFEWWQPEGAIKNGRLDLTRVRHYDIRPGVSRKPGVLMLDNVIATNRKLSAGGNSPLRVCQIGYERTLPRCFTIANAPSGAFALFDEKNFMVHSGTASAPTYWSLAGDSVRNGCFNEVVSNGRYTLVLQESDDRQNITIADHIHHRPFYASVKAFYFQRSGVDLPEQYAGKWKRKAGHPDNRCTFHPSTGKSGTGDVHGGWYDAGDYGKYTVPAGLSIGTMLSLYELFPGCISDSTGIPESGNRISDLLDEVRFELDFLSRMQDNDGGVYFKVGTLAWDNFTMPSECASERFIIGKSTSSTLNFAAIFAIAGRVYTPSDPKFAAACRKHALDAWKWATANPAVREPSEAGGTGAYGDNVFTDEFFWAASELYLTTKKGEFRKYCNAHASKNLIRGAATWSEVGNLGVFSLINHGATELHNFTGLKASLIKEADRISSFVGNHPQRIPAEQFIWGSNSCMLNFAIILCQAYHQTKKRVYLENVNDIVSYLFGNNPTGYSFVTGFGSRSPLHIHHRITGSDNIPEPFPGFVVGGPNAGREDENRNEPGVYYPSKEPAKSYIDIEASYASNEVALNWNAALVFVLGFLDNSIP